MKEIKFSLLAILALLFTACQSGETDQSNDKGKTSEELEIMEREDDNRLEEHGLVKSIKDAGYPFFTISLIPKERDLVVDFRVNVEELSISVEQLNKLIGKSVGVFYTSKEEIELVDIHHNEISILGGYDLLSEQNYDWREFRGILNINVRGGISITNTNEESMTFELPIDESLTKINGELVTAFYSSTSVRETVEIRPYH